MRLTTDRAEIMAVLGHPDIWPCVAPESVAPDDFEPPLHDHYYLIVGELLPEALFIYHWIDEETLKTHHQVIPEYREKALDYSIESLRWAFTETGAARLVCSIPDRYQNVLAHARRGGFFDWYHENGQQWLKLERMQWALQETL